VALNFSAATADPLTAVITTEGRVRA
jgi:hypothetical protein